MHTEIRRLLTMMRATVGSSSEYPRERLVNREVVEATITQWANQLEAALLAASPAPANYVREDCEHCGRVMYQHISPAPEEEGPTEDYVSMLREARKIVDSSPLYNRFMKGTPLYNDVPIWMVDFALRIVKEHAAAIREAPALPPQDASWQPIETAPKDGRWLLLVARSGLPDVGRWFDQGRYETGFWAVHAIRWEATHWMPLPLPPASPSPQDEGRQEKTTTEI